MYVIEG